MRRFAKYTLWVCGIALLTGVMALGGYNLFNSGDVEPLKLSAAESIEEAIEEAPVIAVNEKAVLSSEARITYRYNYLKDGFTESNTEEVPYFLVGLSSEELSEKLMGWELVSFSPGLAVFEKNLNARRTEHYTVGIREGYVAVFYDEEVDGDRLKEQTEIPIDALSEDELSRLTAGIRVIGEEQLVKVLEDYSS